MSEYTHGSYEMSDKYGNLQKTQNAYTPSTEAIRLEYSRIGSRPQREEVFDRWLFQVTEDAFDKGYEAGLNDALSTAEGEGSGNPNSQPTAETPAYLNRQGEEK